MKVLDLFSGIGGFSLGLERAGMETMAFCEIDPFCRKVLRKHWPDVPIHQDIRELEGDAIGPVDVICGGFPCQDISQSGKKAGIQGQRSGLWREYARLVGELRRRFVIVENSAALLHRGLGDVLGDLAALGYNSEWHSIPAAIVGADQERDRIWIMADREAQRCRPILVKSGLFQKAMENSARLASDRRTFYAKNIKRVLRETQPGLDRVADDVSQRLDRLRALGNAVVPQIPEIIGRAIMEIERQTTAPHGAPTTEKR